MRACEEVGSGPDPQRKPQRELAREPWSSAVERVLVVEDDSLFRVAVANVLRLAGYDVVTAVDGRDAFRLLELDVLEGPADIDVDMIVTDVRMPRMSGLDLLAGLRLGGYRVPVVLMSGAVDGEVLHEARRFDAAAVLRKPFSFSDLLQLIDGFCAPSDSGMEL